MLRHLGSHAKGCDHVWHKTTSNACRAVSLKEGLPLAPGDTSAEESNNVTRSSDTSMMCAVKDFIQQWVVSQPGLSVSRQMNRHKRVTIRVDAGLHPSLSSRADRLTDNTITSWTR